MTKLTKRMKKTAKNYPGAFWAKDHLVAAKKLEAAEKEIKRLTAEVSTSKSRFDALEQAAQCVVEDAPDHPVIAMLRNTLKALRETASSQLKPGESSD